MILGTILLVIALIVAMIENDITAILIITYINGMWVLKKWKDENKKK
jgi:hypothetical protein